jgi:hypothetical protein
MKYVYKDAAAPEKNSTVVVLTDGSLLELRRGTKTIWGDEEVRAHWPSLEAWKSTLPEESRESISTVDHTALRTAEMQKALDALKITYTSGYTRMLPSFMVRRPGRAEFVKTLETRITGLENLPNKSYWQIQQLKRLRRDLACAMYRDEKERYYMRQRKTHLFARRTDGSLQQIYIHAGRGVFGKVDAETGVVVASSIADLGGFAQPTEFWVLNNQILESVQ